MIPCHWLRSRWKSDWPKTLAIVTLGVHAFLAIGSLNQQSVTIDEYSHLPAGLSYWETGSFFAYRVNPPLVKMLAALPVLAERPVLGLTQNVPDARGEDERQGLGRRFLEANQDKYFHYFFLGRFPIVLISVFGGWCVFLWARELFGGISGVLATALWAFCPNMLAHGQLITADMGAASSMVAASYFFWRWLAWPGWKRALAAGVLLGIAQLTKFTCLVLYPTWAFLWLASLALSPSRIREPGPSSSISAHGHSNWQQLKQLLTMSALSLLVLNAGYGFEGTLKPLGEFEFKSEGLRSEQVVGVTSLVEPLGAKTTHYELAKENTFRGTWLRHLPIPFPKYYVSGFDLQKADFESLFNQCYLRGEMRQGGWWYYYLYALGVKLPLGTLVVFVLAFALFLIQTRFRSSPLAELAMLLPGAAVLALVSSQTGYNAHLRYVLPFFPFLFIHLSRIGIVFGHPVHEPDHAIAETDSDGRPQALLRWGVTACLVWNVVSAARIHPHYLSYFNELVGGPEHGGEHLLDSNIDWGQDLFFLKRWLDYNPRAGRLGLAYFGSVDPAVVGIGYTLPPFGRADDPSAAGEELACGPQPGWSAVSVNFVYGMGFTANGVEPVPPKAYTYFQHFQPVARAGYSINIYHITEEEADAVRAELGLPPLAMEKKSTMGTIKNVSK